MVSDQRNLITPKIVVLELARLCGIGVPNGQPSVDDSRGDFGMRLTGDGITIATASGYDVLSDQSWFTVSLKSGSWEPLMTFKMADLSKSLDDFSDEFLAPIAKEYRERLSKDL